MNEPKSMPMRIDEDVREMVNLLIGEYAIDTGDVLTVSAALRKFISDKRPDIAEKAKATLEAKKDRPKRSK